MSTTIREHFREQFRLPLIAMSIAGVIVLAGVWFSYTAFGEKYHTGFVAQLIGWGVFFWDLYLNRTPCPKCGARLGVKVSPYRLMRGSEHYQSCPYCGVSFDEPMPIAPIGRQPPVARRNIRSHER